MCMKNVVFFAILSLLTASTALADESPLAPEQFSYEDCMTSDDSKSLSEMRPICNPYLIRELNVIAKEVTESVNEKSFAICSKKEDLSAQLSVLFQYFAQMQRKALDSSGITDEQIKMAIELIPNAQVVLTYHCE